MNMTIQLASTEEIYLRLYRKLSNDWIVIDGDPVALNALEYAVYTPGTPRNADIEMALLSGHPPRAIMIGRKRPELRNILQLEDDPAGWESLFLLNLKQSGDLMVVETGHLKPGVEREQYMEDFVRDILGIPVDGAPHD
jgi:hypothetical protein